MTTDNTPKPMTAEEVESFAGFVMHSGYKSDGYYRRLIATIDHLRAQLKQMEKDAREDARSVAAEQRWRERQGEDYGSY